MLIKSTLRKKLIYFLLFIKKSNVISNLRTIEKLQEFDKRDLSVYQESKLKELIVYSYQHIPYYKKVLYGAKVINSDLEVNLKNFDKIPILTKEILNEEFENLKSEEIKKMNCSFNSSGGSTGEPVRFIQDRKYMEWNIANKLFFKIKSGATIGCSELRFWGKNRDIIFQGKLSLYIRNFLYNRKEVRIYNLSEEDLKKYVKIWKKYKPQWVEGYVEALVEFAKFILKYKIELPPPKGIISTAGTLYEHDKKILEKAFSSKIYNRYGSREVGDMAFGENELEISAWNQKIEILENNSLKKAKKGRVIVTNLNNYSMPLIRYEIGDIAEFSDNEYFLKEVKGREISLFKSSEGEVIDASYFTLSLIGKSWIKRYQVIQRGYKEVEYQFIPFVKDFKIEDNEREEIEKHVKSILGDDCIVNINFVDKINCLKSGKFLYTRSEVK